MKNLMDNTPGQPSKFRTKNCDEMNGDSRGTYNTNSQNRFKTSILESSLCDYSDVYILVNATIKITRAGAEAAVRQADERNKGEIFKNCTPSSD